MAQELIDKIRAAAQAKGIDPETALRIARAESALTTSAKAGTSSAGGLFQVVDKTWKEFGGAPGKKFDPDENIRVGTDIIAKNSQTLKAFLQRDPRPAEVYAAHYFGPSGAKTFLSAEPGTPMESLFSEQVIKANPNLKGKTSDQVMATLEKKMGGKPAAPVVSRETSAPVAREPLPPSLPPMAAAPAPAPADRMAALGPSYQAALALSFLADTDEKEDRDIDREPGIAEKWLAEQSTSPSVTAQFADVSIKSPFAQPQQPKMLAGGGMVQHMSGGGLPFVPTATVRPSARRELDAMKTGSDQYNKDVEAYNKATEAWNAGPRDQDFTMAEPVAPSFTQETYNAKALAARRDAQNRSLALQVAADPKRFGLSMDRLFAEGGEVEKGEAQQALEKYLQSRDEMPDIKVTGNLPEGTNGLFTSDNLNIGSGTIKIHKNTPKAALSSLLVHELTHAADRQMRQQAIEQGMFGNSNQYTEAYEKLVGPDGRNRTQFARNLRPEWAAENRLYRADPKEIAAYGVGAFAGPTLQGPGPRHVDATAATELRILMDLAQRNVDKGPTGLEKIPAFFRKMGRYADGGDVQERLTPQQIERMAEQEAMERENASKPAFLTPKSGKGRQISTKTGELEMAALQGVSEMPYNLLGAPVDLATMAMRPFGYDVEKPMGGSEDLKQRALDAGIRQKPPEGKAARALYELTQATSGAVNPAAPVRGAVKAAEKTGEAAKMLARDFQQYNRQLDVPGASYAVRNRGTPFMMSYGNNLTEGPDGKFLSMDQPENYVKGEVATTMDDKLNEWLLNRVPAYLRRDFATPDDQFVKAADANQLLHFVNKPVKRRDLDPYYDRADNISGIDSLPYVRQTEGFDPQGTAKTEYGKRAESLTDASAWPVQLEDITSPGLIPPSMRNMAETNPTARVTELGTNIDSTLQLPELAADMAKMRRMPKTFSVYSQPPVKVPEEYLLTDEALGGLTLAQASNRVAKFRKWEEETRQGMASTAAFKDPSISRTPAANGHVWVNPPDLEFNPAMRELIQNVGCDGGWCTKGESQALSYGSGENRLSVLMDSKARPKAQITIRSSEPTADDFLMSMDDAESAQFKAAYPDLALYDTRAIRETPEYREWAAINPPRTEITEIKGVNNETDLTGAPYLKQIQQRIKDLDSRGDLQNVDNLDGIGMTDLAASLWGHPAIADRPGIGRSGMQAISEEMSRLNGGSRFIENDKTAIDSIIKQATDNVLGPQQRATGGMIERQSTDSRKYL